MTEGNATPGAPPPPAEKTAEDEDLPMGLIFGIAVGILVFFTLAVLFTGWLMKKTEEEAYRAGRPGIGASVGKQQVGMLEQTLFERQRRAELLRDEQRKRLQSYGWASPERKAIHIPIDRAMELVAQGKRPEGAP